MKIIIEDEDGLVTEITAPHRFEVRLWVDKFNELANQRGVNLSAKPVEINDLPECEETLESLIKAKHMSLVAQDS